MSLFPALNWLELLPVVESLRHAVVVDGGGTGSRAVLADADGTLRGYAEGGPTSGRAVGNDTALANLTAVVAAAIDDAGISYGAVDYCLVTSAAVDTKSHSAFLCDGLSRALRLRCPIAAVPDTLGCWAVTNGLRPAVAAIAGTGSVVLAGDLSAGLCYRLGGWDFLLGDEGSGFGIGRAMLRETMRVGEERSTAQDIANICLSRLGIQHPDEVPDRVTKHIDKALVASLAEDALSLAARGDEVARELVSDEVHALVELVVQGAARLPASDDPLHVGQFGGLFSSKYYASLFQDFVTSSLGASTVLLTPPLGALNGGLSLALWRAGGALDDIPHAARRLDDELTRRRLGRPQG
jgi:N-acetylglucosamine kinase-like BadF-type ATPase